ncbi:hypothetical protein [Aeromicrobium sp. Root472D3]|uniref:hypothetical protein n=1 Tax=Aeromicrobium sp. Root472D3 TaxID=1736540 RepID=UPI000701FA88|nr:hypothetical protein [Aeromicrobium sp. Root472D3]KQX74238.1 hypothetical protein ASD10_03030 [Aeromicrobium sp. Root472D3]
MPIPHLVRVAAATATLAVAATALAMPASASTESTVSAAAARAVADLGPGTFSTADLAAEDDLIDSMEALADQTCNVSGQSVSLNSDVVLLNVLDSGAGPVAALVSADINLDDDQSVYERTCNFAFLVSEQSTTFDGSYSFAVTSDVPDGQSSSLDPLKTVTGSLNGEYVVSTPTFTTVTEFADASLTSSGSTSKLTPAQRTVRDVVTTPKSAQAKKAAKKKYDKAVKTAKKTFKKAGKTKKAKKVLARKTAAAKKAYARAIAPTSRAVDRVETYTARTPWSMSGTLDYRDAV